LPLSNIGFLVPKAPWTARIVGVASKAIILAHGDGAAIAIVGTASNMDARAFAIEGDYGRFALVAAAELARGGSRSGAAAAFDGVTLRASLRDGDLAEAAGDAILWDPRDSLRSAGSRAAADCLADAADAIEAMVRTERDGREREGIHGDGAFALAFRKMKAAPGFPATIVGFGPGSTPSGDDWLAGYLTGRDLLEGGPGEAEPGLRTAVEASLGRTSAAGKALLLGALAGAPPAYLVELALAATDAEHVDRLRNAVREALGHGASSGEDAIAGFVAAIGCRRGRYDAV
jgi:hypothetical protein